MAFRFNKPRTAYWKITLGILLGLGLCLVFVLGWLAWFYFDDPPPDDSDLLITLEPAHPDDNGMTILDAMNDQDASESVFDVADGEPDLNDLLKPEDGAEPDWEAMRQRLEEKREHLARIDAILAAPRFHGPWPVGVDTTIPGITPALELAEHLEARARLQLHDGQPDAAWATLTQMLQLGERMENAKLPLIGFMVGVLIKTPAFVIVANQPAAFAPDADTTRQRTDQLTAYFIEDEDMRNAFRGDYLLCHSVMNMMDAGVPKKWGLLAPYVYKPNRTRTTIATYFREIIDNVGRPNNQITTPFADELVAEMDNPPFYYHFDNFIGKMVLTLGTPSIHSLLHNTNEYNAQLQLSRLALALAAYAREHGDELPATLEALTPDYIDAIPLDPITGGPFHYDAAKRKAWSVGKDLTDDGGLPLGDRNRDDPHDIVIEIPVFEPVHMEEAK